MPQTIIIHITPKSIALLLAALAAVWLLVIFNKLLLILFMAILLAIAIDPLVDWLEAWHLPRPLGIGVIYLLLLGILGAVGGLLVPIVIAEWSQLSARVPTLVHRILDVPKSWISPYFPALGQRLAASDLSQRLSEQIGAILDAAGGLLVAFGTTLTTIIVSTLLILILGFFLTSDARFAPRVLARFFPPRYRPTAAMLAQQIGGQLGHWVRAQVLVGLFFGTAFGLGLALLGMPYALSLGVAGAILEFVPYVGGATVTVVAMLLALTVAPWLPLAVLGLYLLVATIESHIVYPKLVGDIVGLHPVTILVALFIGAEAKGVLGALVAVPVAVVLQVLFDHFYPFEPTRDDVAVVTGEREAVGPQLPPSVH
jgi:predicted PurR-regulated permease PerM